MTDKINEGSTLRNVLQELRNKSSNIRTNSVPPSLKRGERHSTILSGLLNDLTGNLPMQVDETPAYMAVEINTLRSSQCAKFIQNISVQSVGLSLLWDKEPDPLSFSPRFVLISTGDGKAFALEIPPSGCPDYLKELFYNRKICKVLFDAKLFLRFLYAKGFNYDVFNIIDILLLEQLLYSGEQDICFSFDDVLLRELAKNAPPVSMPFERTGVESVSLLMLAKELWPRIKEANLLEVANLEHNCVKTVALMENNGVYFDVPNVAALHNERIESKAFLAHELSEMLSEKHASVLGDIPRPINLDSYQQVKASLLRLGIKVNDTSEDTLLPLASKYPVIANILEYRKLSYSLNNFSGSFLKRVHPKTGRIHSSFGQIATDTGRFNSTNPCVQNVKNGENREYIATAPGNVLVIGDYKQIDIVVAAVMSGDPVLLEEIRQGKDIHVLMAMELTGKASISEITSEERKKAKAVNFGLLYQITPYGLCIYARITFGVNMSIAEAEKAISLHKLKYKVLAEWEENVIAKSTETHETRTLLNRRRLFNANLFTINGLLENDEKQTLSNLGLSIVENNGSLSFTVSRYKTLEVCSILDGIGINYSYCPGVPKPSEVVNSPVQGTAADIIKLAMIYLMKLINQKLNAKLTIVNHDELVLECPEIKKEETAELLLRAMQDAGEHILKIVRPVVNIFTGPNWSAKA